MKVNGEVWVLPRGPGMLSHSTAARQLLGAEGVAGAQLSQNQVTVKGTPLLFAWLCADITCQNTACALGKQKFCFCHNLSMASAGNFSSAPALYWAVAPAQIKKLLSKGNNKVQV